jgi:hypothetical protein
MRVWASITGWSRGRCHRDKATPATFPGALTKREEASPALTGWQYLADQFWRVAGVGRGVNQRQDLTVMNIDSNPTKAAYTKKAFALADVVRVSYPGGSKIVKGKALLERIIRDGETRDVVMAEVECPTKSAAMLLKAALRA